jgi:hypothetical protein
LGHRPPPYGRPPNFLEDETMSTKEDLLVPTAAPVTSAPIPEEFVGLKNFVSPRTRQTCLNAVREFIGFQGITDPEELRMIDQTYVIAWRDFLIESGATPETIHNCISAVSSTPKSFFSRIFGYPERT